jgi:hypothetical protein
MSLMEVSSRHACMVQGVDILSDFYYAEECGLSLFKHRKTGRTFHMEKQCWDDLVRCLSQSHEE